MSEKLHSLAEFNLEHSVYSMSVHKKLTAVITVESTCVYDQLDKTTAGSNLLVFKRMDEICNGAKCCAFSLDGTQLACSDGSEILIWDTIRDTIQHRLVGHKNWVNQVAWFFDNKRLASASLDKTCILWSAKTGQILRVFYVRNKFVSAIAVSANGQYLAAGLSDSVIELWQPCKEVWGKCLTGHSDLFYDMTFHPTNCDVLLSGGFRYIVGHDLQTLLVLFRIMTSCQCLCWTANARFFLSASAGKKAAVKLWDFSQQCCVAHYNQPESIYCQICVASHRCIVSADEAIYVLALPWFTFVDPKSLRAAQINSMALLQLVLLQPHNNILTFEQLLTFKGVNVNVADNLGDTALHVAMHLQLNDAVMALKTAGADETIINKAGRTPEAPFLSIFHLLPPELWAIIVCDFCDMRSVQNFASTCREAWHLFTAGKGAYGHCIRKRRGL